MPEKPHSSDLRKGRLSLPETAYFITKRVDPSIAKPLLIPECAGIVISSLLWAVYQGHIRILGFVIMPDHYHLALSLQMSDSLSKLLANIDKYSAKRINQVLGREGAFWQEGFYEHVIRDRKDFDGILEYIHANPVRAGLVDSIEDWEFSTAHEKYASQIDWEWIGPSFMTVSDSRYRFKW